MLFASNFLGVFNDNFLKNGIIFIAVAWSLPGWLSHSQLISIVASGLVLPYLIFSPLGGKLAVRYSKLKIFSLMKLIELPIMLLAIVAFYMQWIGLAIASVFIMGIQSSLYSPSKYSLIRDIGGEKGVSYGSGLFETMAFLGILLGTFFASVVSDHYTLLLYGAVLMLVALLGYIATRAIRAEELPMELSETSVYNPIRFVKENYRFAKKFPHVNSAVFGSSSFWLISNLLQMNIIIHSKNVYGVSNIQTGMVMAFAAIGVALGTGLTGKLSGARVRSELIVPALTGMIALLLIILFVPLSFSGFIVAVMLFAALAGMFQVPNMARVQHAELGRRRGEVIAYLNMANFLFILIGTAFFSLTTALTNENSYAVFVVMIALSLMVLAPFVYELRKTKK